ncbi:unnamed protein product [Rotaria sp. Silwood1]|nr:unnamed protein product [Rotaria sp. Silwood1]
MAHRYDDQQHSEELLTIVDRGTPERLFEFLQKFHRKPFQNLTNVIQYKGVIDDQIDFINCTGTKYNVTPLMIATGKGSYEKVKILLVHGADPNRQCATGDTALNLAVYRQKYLIVELLLQYNANPNVYNQSGKTALHRAVMSYGNENAGHIRTLLNAGADPNIEDRNQRLPLDEAVIANRPTMVDILLSYDRSLVKRAYRAAIIASRLGHDKCLEILLNYNMDPNITDQTNVTPLHVAVRSLRLSTVRLLLAKGANQNIANNRGETAFAIAEHLQPDQKQNFIDALLRTPQRTSPDFVTYTSGNAISHIYPLIRSHSNWTLDSDKFRSPTAEDSSIQNLLDFSTEAYWRCTQSKNAWIIFDLKHEYNITGMRIIGCENHSAPRSGHLDVSNSFNGPWLKIIDFACILSAGNKNDFIFPPLKTRYVRVFILDNYGGVDIQIKLIGFFGIDMRLVDLLRQYNLEKSLNTLLANGINDQETLNEKRDEILNSSDKYLHVNDHFQFIRLIDTLRSPRLTFLQWFNLPQTTVIAGEKLQTFSVIGDEGVTDRVKLEEKLETSPQATTMLMRDLEPIQGRSLVDFPDYTFKYPGRYKIRVVSLESPDIHTPWQEIVVGPILSYLSKLNTAADEHLYRSSTAHIFNVTTTDNKSTTLSQRTPKITGSKKDERILITRVYETDNKDSYLSSLKSIKDLSSFIRSPNMLHIVGESHSNSDQEKRYKPNHYTQTSNIDYYDHSTNTSNDNLEYTNSKTNGDKILIPTQYRPLNSSLISNPSPLATTNNQYGSSIHEPLGYGERIIIPTKFRLQQERINRLRNNGNKVRSEPELRKENKQPDRLQQPPRPYEQKNYPQDQDSYIRVTTPQENKSLLQPSSQFGQQNSLQNRDSIQRDNQSDSRLSPSQYDYILDLTQQKNELSPRASSQHEKQRDLQNRDSLPRDKQSHYNHRNEFQQPKGSEKFSADISPYNNPAQSSSYSRLDSNNDKKIQQQQQQNQRPIRNTDQDHTESFNKPQKITSASFELRGSQPNNNLYTYEPKNTQMELIFKATLEGSDAQNPTYAYIHATTDNKTPINSTPMDNRPISSNNINPLYEGYNQNKEKYSSPSQLLTPGQQTTTKTNPRDDDEDLHQARNYSSENYTPANTYEKIPSKQADNIHSSQLSASPSPSLARLSDKKSKYFFGANIERKLSDDENDETECETFGHDSQARPLTNTNIKRNLDFSPTTYSQYPDNDNSSNLQFKQQSDAGTTTGNTLKQNQQRPSSRNQSLSGKSQDSEEETPITMLTNKAPTTNVDSKTNSYNDEKKNIEDSSSQASHSGPEDATDSYNKNNHDIGNLRPPQNKINRTDDDDDDDGDKIRHNPYQNTGREFPDDDDDDENDHLHNDQRTIANLVKKNPLVEPSQYTSLSEDTAESQQSIDGKKPTEINVRTTDGRHLYTPGIIPPRPNSASTTDITDEITERTPFDKPHKFRRTPDTYLGDSRDNNEDDEDDSDIMSKYPEQNRNFPTTNIAESKTFKNYGTQSEQKSTRNVGTMSEPVQTSNFGNDVQPQSSSTQTLALIQNNSRPQDGKYSNGTISQPQRQDYSKPNKNYTNQRSLSVDSEEKNQLQPPILLRPKKCSDYDRHSSRHRSPSCSTYRPPYFFSPQRSPQTVIPLQVLSSPSEYHYSTEGEKPEVISPNNKYLIPLLPIPNRPRKIKNRPPMTTIETDTSLDGMKYPHHRGAQPEPLSTREFGTTTSLEINYQKLASKEKLDEEEQEIIMQFLDDESYPPYIDELPNDTSILLPSTLVTHPDASQSVRRHLQLPISQDNVYFDDRIKNTESKLHHAQEQQIPLTNTSLVLNIGTENIISQSPDNEFTVPFERHYVYEPTPEFTTENEQFRSSTLKRDDLTIRNMQKILLPVLNSSRTYVIEKQPLHGNPVRQSQTHGNFYLTTSPTLRSLNSSYQADDSEINPLTQLFDTINLNGYEL